MCQQTRDHKSVESLELSLDRVNSWISNCDQKAGLLLATIGVVLAIMFANEFVTEVKKAIFIPFKGYLENPDYYEFDVWRMLFFISLIATMVLCMLSSFYALKSISAKLDSRELKRLNPEMIDNSLLFYVTIASRSFENFVGENGVDYMKDLQSQIYINSNICTSKFLSYKKALGYFYKVLASWIIMYVLYLFI